MDRRCSYVVVIDGEGVGDLRDFAAYLSELGVAKCDVIIIDGSSEHTFARHRRVLCWVGRHVAARPRHRNLAGAIDPVRVGVDLAACDKVIVAQPAVRYSPTAIDEICALLDTHEAVEPQDYVEPLPWWGGIEAGRMLVQRAIEPSTRGATFAFRRNAVRGLRDLERVAAPDVFVRRLPPTVDQWLQERPRQAGDDFDFPMKTALFLALIPLAMLLAAFGGARLAGGYAGAIAFASVAMALRGRAGASSFFPLRACLYAPLWVLERSVSVYWALFRKLRAAADSSNVADLSAAYTRTTSPPDRTGRVVH
jgi:hypothetical protein